MYKTDLHVHTKEVSACAGITAPEVVAEYKKAGYDSIVITNHCTASFFDRHPELSWESQVDRYLKGYWIAQECGKEAGLHVVLGMELTFRENRNDYLIYGIDRELLLRHPFPCDLTLKQFRGIADEEGLEIYQAHPFRPHMTVMPVKYLDGMEINNGHTKHSSNNPATEIYARINGLKGISGSDCHVAENAGTGGILTDEPVTDSHQLATILKSGRYELIRSDRVL